MWKTFELFLKERGAWKNYLHAIIKAGMKLSDMKRVAPRGYLSSFKWDKTPQGNEYWFNLDREWLDTLLSARK